MQKYKTLIRTTLQETDNLPLYGIYVIAYMGKILYIGQTTNSPGYRLQQHIEARDDIDVWMYSVNDWDNVRLDVLEAPDIEPVYWMKEAEAAMIAMFNPLFNVMCNVV